MILGINTATSISQIALIKDNRVIEEDFWKSEQNEAEKLLPNIQKLLNQANIKWHDIKKLAVIQGPGPFTALRVSIAVVNALAYGLNVTIIPIPVEDYFKHRFEGNFVLYAGTNRVFYNNELISFDDFIKNLQKDDQISGFLREEQIEQVEESGAKWLKEEELPSLGEVLIKISDEYKEESIVKPLYFAPPNITVSDKPYK